jgi:hypothetical protein
MTGNNHRPGRGINGPYDRRRNNPPPQRPPAPNNNNNYRGRPNNNHAGRSWQGVHNDRRGNAGHYRQGDAADRGGRDRGDDPSRSDRHGASQWHANVPHAAASHMDVDPVPLPPPQRPPRPMDPPYPPEWATMDPVSKSGKWHVLPDPKKNEIVEAQVRLFDWLGDDSWEKRAIWENCVDDQKALIISRLSRAIEERRAAGNVPALRMYWNQLIFEQQDDIGKLMVDQLEQSRTALDLWRSWMKDERMCALGRMSFDAQVEFWKLLLNEGQREVVELLSKNRVAPSVSLWKQLAFGQQDANAQTWNKLPSDAKKTAVTLQGLFLGFLATEDKRRIFWKEILEECKHQFAREKFVQSLFAKPEPILREVATSWEQLFMEQKVSFLEVLQKKEKDDLWEAFDSQYTGNMEIPMKLVFVEADNKAKGCKVWDQRTLEEQNEILVRTRLAYAESVQKPFASHTYSCLLDSTTFSSRHNEFSHDFLSGRF